MATVGGNNSVRDGLVFYYDTGNKYRSFKGEPTTNIITNTNLDTGWSKGYCSGIRWNDIEPPKGVESPVVSFHDKDNQSGYWFCYGDYAPQVPGETYTISIYVKTRDSNFRFYGYTANNSETGRVTTNTVTVPNDGEWHRVIFNPITNPSNSQSDSLSFKFDYGNVVGETQRTWLCAPQMEAKNHATPFTPNTRTESLFDLSSNSVLDVSNVSFDSNGIFFDGVDDKISVPSSDTLNFGTDDFTIEFIANKTAGGFQSGTYVNKGLATSTGFGIRDGYFYVHSSVGEIARCPVVTTMNKFEHHVFAVTQSSSPYIRHYIDGVLYNNSTNDNATNLGSISNALSFDIGFSNAGGVPRYFDGLLPVVKLYRKYLTQGEVKRNYNSYKNRFGLQ
jgi:hypothetical protein